MVEVALVTWSGLPHLGEDGRELARALEARGASVRPAVWSDPSTRWERFDLAVVRSTWDYHRHAARFLEWIGKVERRVPLWNPPHVLRWNSSKTYLAALEARGVRIVPTRFCRGPAAVREALRAGRWPRAVVKPAVSADAYRTVLVEGDAAGRAAAPLPEILEDEEMLVQPYLTEVERSGERSLVFLGGRYSHAFLRAPKLAASPSALLEGAPARPTEAERHAAEEVVRAAPGPTVYARVDLVPDADGPPRLMELELIEPFLGLRSSRGAAERLAELLLEPARRSLPPERDNQVTRSDET